MTDDSYQIDVGAHFWQAEEKDPLVASIEAMLSEYGERLLYFIREKQAEAAEKPIGVLWDKFECPTLVKRVREEETD
jgi:hypothetical protein